MSIPKVPNNVIIDYLRACALAAGSNPSQIPDQPFRMLAPKEAWEMLGIKKTKFYELAKQGAFKLISVDRRAA
jgi:hypothetical protein